MPFVTANAKPVLIGNPDAEHTITIVTNPFCQPCANAHKIIERLLVTNENLNCKVIFTASNHEGDTRGVVARTILSLPEEQQAEALTEWYKNDDRNLDKWQKQMGKIEDESTKKIIDYHLNWCDLANIKATPTIYLDGFKMPESYYLEDLRGILKHLPVFQTV